VLAAFPRGSGDPTKAAIAERQKFSALLRRLRVGLTYLKGSMPRDATPIRSIAQLEASISDVNLTRGTAQQATAPPYGSWPARRL
jgi:hypothetical protein